MKLYRDPKLWWVKILILKNLLRQTPLKNTWIHSHGGRQYITLTCRVKRGSVPVFPPLGRSFVPEQKKGKPYGVSPYSQFCVHVHAVDILRY